jgi:TetR/AcrR family transcriptional repressor of nem operon
LGRPRTFDDGIVLDAALACFWAFGYKATSVRQLTDAMGISGPSLYNAFGDKHELYAEVLEHYCRTRTHPFLERIELQHAGVAALIAFFTEVVDRSIADRQRRGCFLVNSALEVAPHDKMMAKVVASHFDAIRGFLRRQLHSAQASDEIKLAADAGASADHLLSVLLGLRVLARSRPERELLERTVCSALIAIGVRKKRLGTFRAETRAVVVRPRNG